MGSVSSPFRFRVFGRKQLHHIPQIQQLPTEQHVGIKAVAAVLPFRVNNYVVNELIDWRRVPDDPIFQLTFPQPGMLDLKDFLRLQDLVVKGVPDSELLPIASEIHRHLNPHPGGQMELNVPRLHGQPIPGCQHKYDETVLYFPFHGQTCHAYCTYCFRWAQFSGAPELRFASRGVDRLIEYLRQHPEVTDILFTGGDPLVMKSSVLWRYLEPLLAAELEHLTTIRIGTKSLAYWPYRFTTDADADDLLRLFEQVTDSGRQLALMAHSSHPRELEPPVVAEAIARIRSTGAVIRAQAPMVHHVNDHPSCLSTLWRNQVRLGIVPYYLFIARDTGPQHYFEVPLARALEIFSTAYSSISGLARTVRGPSMSATPGKVLIDGLTRAYGEKVFVLKMIQGRDSSWANRVFFARFDQHATWLDDLEPAFGEDEFFFSPHLRAMRRQLLQIR